MHRHGPTAPRGANPDFCAIFALSLLLAAPAVAEPAARFVGDGAAPLAPAVRSLRVTRPEEPLRAEASNQSVKRGAAERGARLPVFGARRGPGCSGRWFLVGPHAFVCEEGVEASDLPPLALDAPARVTDQGLPYEYYFVAKDGSFGYRGLEIAEEGIPDAQFQPGFGIAVTRVQSKSTGDAFALTSRGFWVPLRDLVPARSVPFEGSAWSAELGWIVAEAAPVFSAPGRRRAGVTLERLTTVSVLETRALGGQRYARVGEHEWVREDAVRRPALAAPPPEALPLERWIDIDLARQTVVAYVGSVPVFATLTSTGRGPVRSDARTPPGTFRLWIKLRSTDMDNLENVEADENYAIEAVPWVMFFHKGYGLHGTFWHRRFGEVRSHGCVNLAPRDAERLFHWASPRLFPGWSAAFPSAHELGTLVRVRAE